MSATLGCSAPPPGPSDAGAPPPDAGIWPRIQISDCVQRSTDGGIVCRAPTDDLLVDFGDFRIGLCRSATLGIRNIGDATLVVEGPFPEARTSAPFEIDAEVPGRFEVVPEDTKTLGLRFCLLDRQRSRMQTTLVFRSNAPDQPEVTVTLSAIDSTDYPIICTCVPNHVETRVGQSLLVSAQCIDAELQPLQYSWTVERRPPHSVARFAMPHSPSASILLDEPTTVHSPYVFLATATDTFGASGSCTITALAPAANAISVQLTTDEDQARLDLHLLNPDGITAPYGPQGWFSSPNDCHVNNPTPDWGVLGDERDDPGMAGNALVFTRPAAGLYRVGAHLACADPRGPTTATARVFCGGSLVAEFGPRLLTAEGAFWEIAEVAFPSCRINGLDRVLQHTRACASQDLGEGAFVSADGGS